MESLHKALDEIEALLDEERSAIARADSARVLELASLKDSAWHAVVEAGIGDRPELMPRMRKVVDQLRENLVLLVHARACVTDVLQAVAAAPATYHGSPARLPTGARVSVSG